MSDLIRAVTELGDAQAEYIKAEQYYNGDTPEVFASPKMRRALERTGTSFRLNFARVPVQSVLDRMEVQGVAADSSRAQEALDALWVRNQMDAESEDINRWGLVYGEAYAIVWPDEDGNAEVSYNSPRTTRVFYSPENPRRKAFGAKVWTEGKRTRVNLYYPDRIEKYLSKKEATKRDEDFEPYYDLVTEAEDGSVVGVWPENPYGQVPVFHFRTQRPYGRPEHKDAWSPQDMVNKTVITQQAATDFYGFPQRYVLAGNTPSNEVTDFADDDALDDEATLTSGPGELWWLNGENLSVGQFPTADVDNFLKPLETYIRAMAALTQTPIHHFQGMGDAPSGESLRAAEAPLVKKVKDRIQNFDPTYQEALTFALLVEGIEVSEVTLSWANPESHDDSDTWVTAKAKLDAGVPFRQVMKEAGYSEAQVTAFEEATSDVDVSALLDLAERVGTAVQRLGLGVNYGILDADEAREFLPLGTPS